MIPYLLIFILTAYIAFIQFKNKKKASPKFFGTYVFALGVFVGISDMLGGYDRYIYCDVFTTYVDEMSKGNGIFNDYFIDFDRRWFIFFCITCFPEYDR